MTVLFAIGILVFVHAYVVYPFSLVVLGWIFGDRSLHETGETLPSATLVISAYNEERCIREKLENSLALDYPAERLRIVVVSDGSTDRTLELCRPFIPRGVEVRALPGRRGKVACLNEVIPTLDTDLVVMSDANSIYDRRSLRLLARHFADPRIGCVCGRLRYLNPGGEQAGQTERVYWGYEGWIKKLESRIGSLLGANGSIYAYRRPQFRPVDPLMFCDDVIPIRIALDGKRVVYDPDAWCSEETSPERVEMRRRRRHASFGMRSMLAMMQEAAGRGNLLILYQCVSHRVLRWLGGPALLGLLASTPFLAAPWREAAATGQALLYSLAVLGLFLDRRGIRLRPAYIAYYGIAIHAAGLSGLAQFVLRRDKPFWEPRQ